MDAEKSVQLPSDRWPVDADSAAKNEHKNDKESPRVDCRAFSGDERTATGLVESSSLRVVMVANLVVAALIVSVSAFGAALLVVATLLAIAVEVGGFAVSQFVALRRIARSDSTR